MRPLDLKVEHIFARVTKMALNLFIALIGLLAVITVLSYACLSLLKLSQRQEDTEHERLWRYLLRPSRP